MHHHHSMNRPQTQSELWEWFADARPDRPTKELNFLWLLLVLFAVTASAPVDVEAAAAEVKAEELLGHQKTVCERLPGETVFAEFFAEGRSGPPDLNQSEYDAECEWNLDQDGHGRRLVVELDPEDEDQRLPRPRLELSGLAERAELSKSAFGYAGALALQSSVGDTMITVTAIDQMELPELGYGAVSGSATYRHLIDTLIAVTSETWTLIGVDDVAAPPPSTIDADRFAGSLCDRLTVPGTVLKNETKTWPPSDRIAGRCSWRGDADDGDVFFVRVEPVAAVPAAEATAVDTAKWLWDIRENKVGKQIDGLGADSAIGIDEDLGQGGIYARWGDLLIQIFYSDENGDAADIDAVLRETAQQTVERLDGTG